MKMFLPLFIFASFLFLLPGVRADDAKPILSYPDNLVLDSDLDGLTDEGERIIFGTDSKNPDSDSDGWYDGTEALANTDPLDSTDPSTKTIVTIDPSSVDVPWVWYITRASGFVAFGFAWITIFLGIAIRLPLLKKMISPVYSLSVHHVIAIQTLFFSLFHGVSFLFDPFMRPTVADIFIPFWSNKLDPFSLSLGILALYGFLVIVATSWLKPMIPHRIWRITHFLNVFVYVAVITHALLLGTDLANPLFRNIFIGANVFLVFLFTLNIILKIFEVIRRTRHASIPNTPIAQ